MKSLNLVLTVLCTLALGACSSEFGVSHVEIADPDVGIFGSVAVEPDGAFAGEVQNGDARVRLSGQITLAADEQYSVTLAYERRVSTSPSTFQSQELNSEFKAKRSIVVPIGKPPEPGAAGEDNGLENLTVRLRPRSDDCCQ